MSEPGTNWFEMVRQYAARGPAQEQDVREAEAQADRLRDTDEFWEAVYTLVHQRAQMREVADA